MVRCGEFSSTSAENKRDLRESEDDLRFQDTEIGEHRI
jgi:hypothetical protein